MVGLEIKDKTFKTATTYYTRVLSKSEMEHRNIILHKLLQCNILKLFAYYYTKECRKECEIYILQPTEVQN